MPREQEETRPETLVPPRPNLGPEPWPDDSRGYPLVIWWILAVALLALLVAGRLRKVQRKCRLTEGIVMPDPSRDADPSNRQRLIAASELVRGALIDAFGSGWGSKTTEEIGNGSGLVDKLGASDVERLVEFLQEADRVKFAEAEPSRFDEWEPWAETFVKELAAGARSRIIGK